MLLTPTPRGTVLATIVGLAAVGVAVMSSNSSVVSSDTPRPPWPGNGTRSNGSVAGTLSVAHNTGSGNTFQTMPEATNSSTASFTIMGIFSQFLPDVPRILSSTTTSESGIRIIPHETSRSNPFPSTSYPVAGASTLTTIRTSVSTSATSSTSATMSSVPSNSDSTQTDTTTSFGSVGPIATSTTQLMGDCYPDGALNCVAPDGYFFQHCANGKWTIGYLVEDGTMCVGNATMFAIIPRPQ